MIRQRVGKQPFGAAFLCRYRWMGDPFRFAPEINFVSKTEWDPVFGSRGEVSRSINHGGVKKKRNHLGPLTSFQMFCKIKSALKLSSV